MSPGGRQLLRRPTSLFSLPSGGSGVGVPRRTSILPYRLPVSQSSLSLRLFFSSHSHPSPADLPPSHCDTSPSSLADNIASDVTTPELKKRIKKYLDGDAEALPSIFEAILARKLSGHHEDTDDELMEELRSNVPHDDNDNDCELSESDEDLSESDEDLSESDAELSD